MNKPIRVIALLTDFGLEDHYVGTMKGVILSRNPQARIVDITHDVRPQRVRQAGYLLWASYRFFPPDTIFVCVVDPGVGSSRRIIAVRARRATFLAPDNGALDFILAEEPISGGVQIYPFSESSLRRRQLISPSISTTFHGRDIFAPVAALLSMGKPLRHVGTTVEMKSPSSPFTSLQERRATAHVVNIDHFGNVITNIRAERTEDELSLPSALRVNKKLISTWIRYYDEAPPQTPCLIVGSNNLIEIVVRNGSASKLLSLDFDSKTEIVWR